MFLKDMVIGQHPSQAKNNGMGINEMPKIEI